MEEYSNFIDKFNEQLKNSTKVKDTLNIKEQILQAEIDLQLAVESENYEEAAIQRDLLIELKEQQLWNLKEQKESGR